MPPNILYILADDMGYGDMGCNNPDSKIPTPNLDRLAGQGMRFTDAHAPSSVCTPSRYAILTGRYCWRTRLKAGVLWPWDPALIEPERPTVASYLRGQGYQTACIGKWHLGWNWATRDGRPANEGVGYGVFDRTRRYELGRNIDYTAPLRGGPVDCGFDSYFGDDVPNFPPYTWFEQDRLVTSPTLEKPAELFGLPGAMAPGWKLEEVMPEITRRAVRFISAPHDKPFFLYLPLTAPHTPVVPLPRFRGMSGAGEYGDYVCEVDGCVGEVLAALERAGLAGNTLVVFTSDNGPENDAYERIRAHGHHSMGGLRGLKRDTWEGGHRVPFVARWPGMVPAGSACDQFVSLADLMATCAGVVGTPLPAGAAEDSVSILPLLRGAVDEPVRAYVVHHSCSGRFAIRCGDWVYLEAPGGDDNREPDWFRAARGYPAPDGGAQLYHLRDDLAEARNRLTEKPVLAQRLAALLEKIRSGSGPCSSPAAGHGQTVNCELVNCEW